MVIACILKDRRERCQGTPSWSMMGPRGSCRRRRAKGMATDTVALANPHQAGVEADGDVAHVRVEGCLWRLRHGVRDLLLGEGAPDWFFLEGDARARRVKRGSGRSTWVVSLGDRRVYAKLFETAGAREQLKEWLVGRPAAREWHASIEAESRGIPGASSLALGVAGGAHRASVIIFAEVEGAVSLDRAWERDVVAAPSPDRHASALALVDAAARLLADAHARGFSHGDGHPRNLLVCKTSAGGYVAVFVDLHAALFFRAAVPERQAVRSLAQLDHFFQRVASRTQRLRFWRCYRALRGVGSTRRNDRLWLSRIARAREAHARKLARNRDRRLRRDSDYFSTMRFERGWIATLALRLERRHVFPEDAVPDRDKAEWRRILRTLVERESGATSAAVVEDCAGVTVNITHLRGAAAVFASIWGSPHRMMFETCHRSRHRDRMSQLVLGYAEHRTRGLIDRTMLVYPAQIQQDRCERP